MTESGLDLGIETALFFYFLHDVIRASPSVKPLNFKIFSRNKALAARVVGRRLMQRVPKSSEKWELFQGTFSPLRRITG
jgi:hypothetical protein